MTELAEGTRRATETCYKCFQEYKFTSEDFLSFLRSIANQSPTLSRLFLQKPQIAETDLDIRDLFEAEDRKSGLRTAAERKPAIFNAASRPSHLDLLAKGSKVAVVADRSDKVEEAVDMTAKLIDRRRKEAQRRKLGAYTGTAQQRISKYMLQVVRRLGQQVQASEKAALTAAIRDYVDRKTTPEEFHETMQALVDKYAIVLPLEYTPEHETRAVTENHKRGRNSSSIPPTPTKRPRVDSLPSPSLMPQPVVHAHVSAAPSSPAPERSSGCPACELDMFGDARSKRRCEQCGHSGKPESVPLARAGTAHRPSVPLGEGCSADLPDCKLSRFLTEQAREVSPAERHVTVKVVARTEHHTGGGKAPRYPYTNKAVFAFQRLDGKEVAVLGMYVHEFGAEAPAPAAGRVYLECIDSIPLHGPERSDERQRLLTSIVHGYLAFIRSEGYTHLHLRVPPPSAEHSHIFAYRSLSVRLEATLRMAHWYKRLLDGAKAARLVDGYHTSSHLSKLEEFPPCLLQSSDLAEEHAFSAMRSTVSRLQADCNDRNESSVLSKIIAFKDRFFVADLTAPCSPPPPLQRHTEPLRPCGIASQRIDFTAVCEENALSFNALADAHEATSWLLSHMIRTEETERSAPAAEVSAVEVKMEEMETDGMPAWVQQQQQQLQHEEHTADHHVLPDEELEGWGGADVCGIADAEMFADSLFSM